MGLIRSRLRVVAVILLGLLVGWFILAITVDRVLFRTAPAVALAWNPGSTDANVWAVENMVAGRPSAIASVVARDHAERALQRQPITVQAVRMLGLQADLARQQNKASALFGYAETLSRRDQPTELWLIENAVRKGNVRAALVHYDRVMRTSPESWQTLFPILDGAAAAPAIWIPLGDLLARRPSWTRPFLEQFVAQASNPGSLVSFARRLDLDRAPSPDPAMLQAIEQRLVAIKAYDAAALLYAHVHRTSMLVGTLRNGSFEQPGGWEPFEWNLMDDPDFAAQRGPRPTGSGQALFLTANNGRNGDVAVQLVILQPGRYQLTAQVGAVGGDKDAYPQLIVRCATDKRELLNQSFPTAPVNGTAWSVDFAVPPGCPAEQVAVHLRSPLDSQDAVPWIDDIALHGRQGG